VKWPEGKEKERGGFLLGGRNRPNFSSSDSAGTWPFWNFALCLSALEGFFVTKVI
jgi:hypothetical protein